MNPKTIIFNDGIDRGMHALWGPLQGIRPRFTRPLSNYRQSIRLLSMRRTGTTRWPNPRFSTPGLKEAARVEVAGQPFPRSPPPDAARGGLFYFFVLRFFRSRKIPGSTLILGAVCRKWRAIAWSSPQLWSSIFLSLSYKSFSSNLRIAQEWLSRSGQLPLSISVSMRNCHSVSMDDVLPMTYLLNKYAGRWHHLEFLAIPYLHSSSMT